MSASFDGFPLVDPKNLYSRCREKGLPVNTWFGKANSFRLVAREPSHGQILLHRKHMEAIRRRIETPSGGGTDTAYPTHFNGKLPKLVFDDGKQSITIPDLVLGDAVCVTPGYETDPLSVYLCDLISPVGCVKERWGINLFGLLRVGYNQLTPLGVPADQASDGTPYRDWQYTLVSAWKYVFDVIGNYGKWQFPGLPFAPQGKPSIGNYEAWESLNRLTHILDRLACVLVWNPITNNHLLKRVGISDSLSDNLTSQFRSQLVLSKYPKGVSGYQRDGYEFDPRKVTVAFRRYPTENFKFSAFDYDLEADAYGGGGSPITASAVIIYDDFPHHVLNTGTTTYDLLMQDRVRERARDYKRLKEQVPETRVYNGIIPEFCQVLGQQWQELFFYDTGDGYRTELIRKDMTFMVTDWRMASEQGPENFGFPLATVKLGISNQSISATNTRTSLFSSGNLRMDYNSTNPGCIWQRLRSQFNFTLTVPPASPPTSATATVTLEVMLAASVSDNTPLSPAVTLASWQETYGQGVHYINRVAEMLPSTQAYYGVPKFICIYATLTGNTTPSLVSYGPGNALHGEMVYFNYPETNWGGYFASPPTVPPSPPVPPVPAPPPPPPPPPAPPTPPTKSWYCVTVTSFWGGGTYKECQLHVTAPASYNSGPHSTYDECVADCSAAVNFIPSGPGSGITESGSEE